MYRFTRFAVPAVLLLLALSAFWLYRVRVAAQAAQFVPTSVEPVLVPAGTAISAVMRNGIASAALAGDTVTAFVSTPVSSQGTFVIPSGAQLKGRLEKFSVSGTIGTARIRFNSLCMRQRCFDIQTRPVEVIARARSDTEIFFTGLRCLIGAGLGAAIGSASSNVRMMDLGLMTGVTSASVEHIVPLTIVLTEDLEV
jgi:hypothetical protein